MPENSKVCVSFVLVLSVNVGRIGDLNCVDEGAIADLAAPAW